LVVLITVARAKATITLDLGKAAAARALLGVDSTPEAVDVALDRLVHADRHWGDIAAYRRSPPTQDGLASWGVVGGLGDDTDWEALYPVDGS
jgi:hypothetical protein